MRDCGRYDSAVCTRCYFQGFKLLASDIGEPDSRRCWSGKPRLRQYLVRGCEFRIEWVFFERWWRGADIRGYFLRGSGRISSVRLGLFLVCSSKCFLLHLQCCCTVHTISRGIVDNRGWIWRVSDSSGTAAG